MALINCPHCGKQISDKAIVCPYCGVETQKLLSKIREKERQQRKERKQLQKKRRKRVIITMASVCVVAAIAVLAYLYYIDALNSIPAEYRKQTEGYFKNCESAISDGDFESGNRHLNLLKSRTLTNRQAKRVSELENALIEEGLGELDNDLAQLENISDDQIDPGVKESIKQKAIILGTYNLDASHAERLKKAKDKFVELFLSTIEKRVDLKEDDTQALDSFEFEETKRLAQELQEMELSTTQSTRLDNAMTKAKRIKELKDDNLHKQLLKTIRDEYVKLLSANRKDRSDYSEEGYFLFDINNNGIPELWIQSGECEADFRLLVFTYDNGIKTLYNDDAGHSSFYIGYGCILRTWGHMGYATWDELTYNGSTITSTKVFEEDINGTNRDYTEPEGEYIKLYPLTNKQPILNAFKTK